MTDYGKKDYSFCASSHLRSIFGDTLTGPINLDKRRHTLRRVSSSLSADEDRTDTDFMVG